MKIARLEISRFTAFEEASFDFSRGVNVLIGENAAGKSHVLKVLYVLNEAVRALARSGGGGVPRIDRFASLDEAIAVLLQQTFLPDELGRLVRRARGRRKAALTVEWTNGARLVATLSNLGRLTARLSGDATSLGRSVFVPTREVLSVFPGFVSAWRERESNFDRTYYDLCTALDAKPLRGPRDTRRGRLLAPIERALGGSVVVENGRFYVRLADGDLEAPLVAEGLRKLAMLAYLVVNGALSENAFLFWDEPETSLNPKLAKVVSELIFELADWGVQVVLATHDYALGSELSLEVEEQRRAGLPNAAAFFALAHIEGKPGVSAERGDRLTDLQENPILDALASLHDREIASSEGESP